MYMKLLTIIFYLHLSIISAYSQGTSEMPKTIRFESFPLGDSIGKFRGSVTCNGKEYGIEIINSKGELLCKQFHFRPAETDSVEVGKVKFPDTYFYVDDQGKIISVDFIKPYRKTKRNNPKKAAKNDFDTLKVFLISLLQTSGEIYSPTSEYAMNSKQSGLTWKKGNVKYFLSIIKIKTKNITLPSTLVHFSIQN